jgi:hypothetical protein
MARSIKNRQRVIDYGEVYTPPGLVNDMLDLVKHECERIDSRFLEPACGNGNFLAEVLRRKLATVDKSHAKNRMRWERDAVLSVCSLYGIDLLADNVRECRQRLLNIVLDAHQRRFNELLPEQAIRAIEFILSRNILQGDALSFRTLDGKGIVFSEWSPVNGMMIKRHDYVYEHLLEEARVSSLPLFSDHGEDVYLPQSVGERPPCHYLELPDAEISDAEARS